MCVCVCVCVCVCDLPLPGIDSSAHLEKGSNQQCVFELHRPKALGRCFQKQHRHMLCLLGQPASLSKEVCLYAGADWLKLTPVGGGGERSLNFTCSSFLIKGLVMHIVSRFFFFYFFSFSFFFFTQSSGVV